MLRLPPAPSYPWRLGTTSFVLPATAEDNVRVLAPQVDAVQLLFFESQANSLLDHQVDVPLLAALANDHDLAYTVHLPLDLELGSVEEARRRQGVDEICRIVEELSPLAPQAFDLHLNLSNSLDSAAWQANLARSLTTLAHRCGEWCERIGVENIGYDFDLVAGLVQEAGFGICVDFGHRLRYNQHTDFWALPLWRHVHLHGAGPAGDHRPFHGGDADFLTALGQRLLDRQYSGVVTLELYDAVQVHDSLAMLHKAWQPFQQGE